MTDFDKKLIEKADRLNRRDYRMIDAIISFADTQEAREVLHNIRWELHDLAMETI